MKKTEQPEVKSLEKEQEKTIEELKVEEQNKINYTVARLRELKIMLHYLESKCKSRKERKQMRRRLINEDNFATSMVMDIIENLEHQAEIIGKCEK